VSGIHQVMVFIRAGVIRNHGHLNCAMYRQHPD
jgi:hypothetical protein